MLRSLLLILIIANVGYFLWNNTSLGGSREEVTEPLRVMQQVRPEKMRVLPQAPLEAADEEEHESPAEAGEAGESAETTTAAAEVAPAATENAAAPSIEAAAPGATVVPAAAEAATADTKASAAKTAAAAASASPAASTGKNKTALPATTNLGTTAAVAGKSYSTAAAIPLPDEGCVQTGFLSDRQVLAVRKATSQWPSGLSKLEETPKPGRWMIYMGRFTTADALQKKRQELRAMNVPYDRANVPTLEPGLSLGRYSIEENAHRALEDLNRIGVRTARIVLERAPSKAYVLWVPKISPDVHPQLSALHTILGEKTWRPCAAS